MCFYISEEDGSNKKDRRQKLFFVTLLALVHIVSFESGYGLLNTHTVNYRRELEKINM